MPMTQVAARWARVARRRGGAGASREARVCTRKRWVCVLAVACFTIAATLCVVVAPRAAQASNTQFLAGDAYFATFVAHDAPSPTEALTFSYFLRPDRLMKCGYHGIDTLTVSDGSEQLRALLTWARARAWKALEHPWGTEQGFYLVFVPKDYNVAKYGFFLRYNEAAARHKSHGKIPPMGGGVHVDDKSLRARSRKLARRVRRLPLGEVNEDGVVLGAMQRIDVYVLDNVSREDYARGKAGLKAWRLRDGALDQLHHDGKRWRIVGPAEGWDGPRTPFRK